LLPNEEKRAQDLDRQQEQIGFWVRVVRLHQAKDISSIGAGVEA
jgi:hypothetical protein